MVYLSQGTAFRHMWPFTMAKPVQQKVSSFGRLSLQDISPCQHQQFLKFIPEAMIRATSGNVPLPLPLLFLLSLLDLLLGNSSSKMSSHVPVVSPRFLGGTGIVRIVVPLRTLRKHACRGSKPLMATPATPFIAASPEAASTDT